MNGWDHGPLERRTTITLTVLKAPASPLVARAAIEACREELRGIGRTLQTFPLGGGIDAEASQTTLTMLSLPDPHEDLHAVADLVTGVLARFDVTAQLHHARAESVPE
jgi:hypothetical protein